MRNILVICLLILSTAHAAKRKVGTWDVYGGSLAWNVCADSYVVGMKGNDLKLVGTDVEAGYRTGVAYWGSGCYMDVQYLNFHPTYAASFTDLMVGEEELATAVGRRRFRYQQADGRVGIGEMNGFYAFAGARYLEVEEGRELTGPSFKQHSKSRFVGGGGLLGGGAAIPFGGVQGIAEVGGFMGVGELETCSSIFNVSQETGCLPGLEGRVGFRYCTRGPGFALIGEAGYEVLYYWGALRRVGTDGTLRRDSIGFHGAFATVKLRF